jgi:Ca2+-binding RTX toxin-like protein
VNSAFDGHQVLVEGTFHYANGTTGRFVEVALDTALGSESPSTSPIAAGEDVAPSTSPIAAGGDVMPFTSPAINTSQTGEGESIVVGNQAGDIFTGSEGTDTFDFTGPANSLANGFATIADFVSGSDQIRIGHTLAAEDLITGLSQAGTGDLAVDLLAVLNGDIFHVNGVAEVTITSGIDAGTYLIINDATAGFNSAHDAVIRLANGVTVHAGDFVV